MPLGGLTMGTQTILGYNLGARRPDKILKAQRIIFLMAAAFCAVMFLAAQFIPQVFARIFTHPAASILLAPGEVPPVHGANGRIHARVDAR